MIITEPRSEYDMRPELNWSRLRPILISRRAFRSQHLREQTQAMTFGIMAHSILLEDAVPVVFHGIRRGGKWEEFQQTNSGRTILSPFESDAVGYIRDAIKAHPEAYRLLYGPGAIREGTAVGTVFGVPAKCRFDVLNGIDLVDLKIAGGDISARSWARHSAAMGYHQQAAWYRSLTGATNCYTVVAQGKWPYEVAVYRFSGDALAAGYDDCMRAVSEYLALDAGATPLGQYPGVQDLELPAWYYPNESDALEGCE